jgi:hypothetical protein
MTWLNYYLGISLERLSKTTETPIRIVSVLIDLSNVMYNDLWM